MHTVSQKTKKVENALLPSQRKAQTQITVSRKMNKLFGDTMYKKNSIIKMKLFKVIFKAHSHC